MDQIGHDWGQTKPISDFTYIDVSSIDNKRGVISESPNIITAAAAPSRARKIVKKGTVIYSTVRPYLRNIAVVDQDFEPEPIASTAFAILHPFEGIEAKYIYYYLRSPALVAYVESVQSGIAYPAISDQKFFASALPLAPTEEQKRIVAKVDELMALCDKLEAQQQEREQRFPVLSRTCHARFVEAPTLANLKAIFDEVGSISTDELRKSILTLAVRGKLISFDPVNEHQTVGDHFDFLNGYAFKSEWFKLDGIRLCRNVNVSHGFLNWSEPAYVSQEVADEFSRFALSEGDIVLSLDRPLISTGLKVARITEEDCPCLLLQRVAKPLPKHNEIDLGFFYLWLNSSDFVDSIDPGRSNGVPHISTRQIQKIPFSLPPLAEQRRIVAKVDQLMALIDKLEEQQAKKSELAQAFTQAVVAAIAGAEIKEPEKMKAPKTELVSRLQTKRLPNATDPAPLTKLLTKHNGELSAKALWQRSGLEIDAFYQQLRTEMTNGWIIEPEKAVMKEIETD
jgi:type I restriction enzyme S subunit